MAGSDPLSRRILVVLGTRPEAIKLAPVIHALRARSAAEVKVAVTGQHREMLDQVLAVFEIVPDYDLDIMRADQSVSAVTTRALDGLTEVVANVQPSFTLVQGDTTTAFAGALASYYAKVPVGHVEAGLRTGNLLAPFPEEGNRKLIGTLASVHFAPTEGARSNLLKEGVDRDNIFVTGNTAIDALLWTLKNRRHSLEEVLDGETYRRFKGRYLLVTAHRRESFGEPMRKVLGALGRIADRFPDLAIIFPVHLNPNVRIAAHSLLAGRENVRLIEPLDYRNFVHLMAGAEIILTDSGGIQEEAPSVGKPILVLRDETERPEGVQAGVARIVGTDAERIYEETAKLLTNREHYDSMVREGNPYGDGTAAERIADIVGDRLLQLEIRRS